MIEVLLFILAAAVGTFIALTVGLKVAAWWWTSGQRGSPPATGVRIWEGKPGSGKSYGVVGEILTNIRRRKRPVYTNLPLKQRVIRQYLRNRGDANLANYFTVLTEDHTRRWFRRFSELANYCEERSASGVKRKEAEREWMLDHGPHIPRAYTLEEWTAKVAADGLDATAASSLFDALIEQQTEDAQADPRLKRPTDRLRPNWIPYGSVIVMDELHKWFDQRQQGGEMKELLDTLSMHRHGLYQIDVLSQTIMMQNKAFRDMSDEIVICQDLRKIAIIWGLRFPLPTFRYSLVSAVELGPELRDRHNVKPERVWCEAPWLDGGKMWRLYDSFTHVGSLRQLELSMDRSRAEHEGPTYKPRNRIAKMKQRQKQRSFAGSVAKLAVVGLLVLIAFRVGRRDVAATDAVAAQADQSAKETASMLDGIKAEMADLMAAVASRPSPQPEPQPEPQADADTFTPDVPVYRPAVTGAVAGVAVVNGQFIRPGEMYRGAMLLGVDGRMSRWLLTDGSQAAISVGRSTGGVVGDARLNGVQRWGTAEAAAALDAHGSGWPGARADDDAAVDADVSSGPARVDG